VHERHRFRAASDRVLEDFFRYSIYNKGSGPVDLFIGDAEFRSRSPIKRMKQAAAKVARAHGSPAPIMTPEFRSSLTHYDCGDQLDDVVEQRPGHQRGRELKRKVLEIKRADAGEGGKHRSRKDCYDAVRGLRYCSNAGCHVFIDRDVNGALNQLRKGLESLIRPDGKFEGGPAHLNRDTCAKRHPTRYVHLRGAPGPPRPRKADPPQNAHAQPVEQPQDGGAQAPGAQPAVQPAAQPAMQPQPGAQPGAPPGVQSTVPPARQPGGPSGAQSLLPPARPPGGPTVSQHTPRTPPYARSAPSAPPNVLAVRMKGQLLAGRSAKGGCAANKQAGIRWSGDTHHLRCRTDEEKRLVQAGDVHSFVYGITSHIVPWQEGNGK